ncbi:DUF4139 domain-containing protein [Thiolapillus brandeum]|uniref:DUF4139 domain-containing protein n=1 Tax=Thiolapillus brandeum TaxID=1076588 RepID=A0A7U6GGZ5_9GAMM|nr:DUF4139 domain-containing protein [Thiolapillus brandeum]BAO43488.1 conserved hypothetical protein [Thiolapillus brandeum]
MPKNTALLLLATLLVSNNLQADEMISDIDDQTGLAVTIYNEDLALIRDQRSINLPGNTLDLALRGVSARMRPETALLRSINPPGDLQVLEQNFNFDLLTPRKMLEKYTGKTVELVRMNPATGKETREAAAILSTNEGVVVKIGDQVETNPEGRWIFPRIPENLRDRPTLVTRLSTRQAGKRELELTYMSGGLAWKADYVVNLNQGDNALDLAGWVTLTNQSGTTYPNTHLQLVAGDVHQVQENMRYLKRKAPMTAMMEDMAPAPMAEESLFEYHLYTLNRPTTIADNQTKQVALLNASDIPATKELIFEGQDYYYRSRYNTLGQKLKATAYVSFENREEKGLGMPLPKGIVRVYKQDSAGHVQFVGEDRIDHTPRNEQVRLKLGETFDVTASKKQINYKKVNYGHPYNYAAESTLRLELKNAKNKAVTVKVREPIPGDWKIERESHRHRKVAAGLAEWEINIPAEGKVTLEYQVLVRY